MPAKQVSKFQIPDKTKEPDKRAKLKEHGPKSKEQIEALSSKPFHHVHLLQLAMRANRHRLHTT